MEELRPDSTSVWTLAGSPRTKWLRMREFLKSGVHCKKKKRKRETERKRKYYSRKGVLCQKKTSPLPHSAKSTSCFQNVNILKLCLLSRSSCVRLFETRWAVACQATLSMGFSRQEYWSGLPCPPPRDFPNPGIQPRSHIAGGFFTSWATRECLKINEINTWPSNNHGIVYSGTNLLPLVTYLDHQNPSTNQ